MSLFKLKHQAEGYVESLRKNGKRSKITKTSKDPTYKWLVEEIRKFDGNDFFLRGTYSTKKLSKINKDKYKQKYYTRVVPRKIYGRLHYDIWLRKK